MCKTKSLILFLLISISSISQTIEDISFGTDVALEIVTWNIENFPKNNQTTIDYVKRIIIALDADVYAIQEVSDSNSFNQLINALPNYDGYITSDKFRGLAFIYKKSTIQINNAYEIYNSTTFWSPFPRYPMVLDFNFKNEQFILINNHLKCCGDGILNTSNTSDEENRRLNAVRLLKEYIDAYLTSKNVILTGDLNDILTDNSSNNVFQEFINDTQNYTFADMSIATGNTTNWSYPSWPSHLDHILITNELFDEFQQNTTVTTTIKLEEYVGGWNTYKSNISDHRPVALKFIPSTTLKIDEATQSNLQFANYPNPFNKQTTFSFKGIEGEKWLIIYDAFGRKMVDIRFDEDTFTLNTENYPKGFYFSKLITINRVIKTIKLIKQ
ncbi:MAG: endonuclease/exonuclease/phosphatase family protein [Flavobacteriaceae bacterium]|nr:endonuclease/exonuclease/phosphatase family protein [Flavobacteriaceae bacterium]